MTLVTEKDLEVGEFYTCLSNGRFKGMTARADNAYGTGSNLALNFLEFNDWVSAIGMQLRRASVKDELNWRRIYNEEEPRA